jgi:Flp pilus assembly pilin Flp
MAQDRKNSRSAGEKPMKQLVKQFLQDEQGAVTVDWVVLTGAIVALALVVMSIIQQGSYIAAASGISAGVTQAANIGSTP